MSVLLELAEFVPMTQNNLRLVAEGPECFYWDVLPAIRPFFL
jgi:hypothetical protein